METKIGLKLLIDNKSHKVIFAEAGKEFVDFIFSLLALPIGSVIKLLSSASMQGSIGNLYQSVKNIDSNYLLPNKEKSSLLEPKICLSGSPSNLLLEGDNNSLQPKIYVCQGGCSTASLEKNGICPTCRGKFTRERTLVVPSKETVEMGNSTCESGGFVRGVVTYMITDKLEVTPMSSISSITLINKFGLNKGNVDLSEEVVHMGMNEGLALLKASLQSKMVLTDVFLGKNWSKSRV
ncbi:hypothetical protein LUZ61_017534 [Rhynchospora tenuis]|uniref:DUF674 domain-containing protein n=1 Tax=Rhynchospora tenuis TaxID=198213 RepID=A0AAD5Z7N3_9POAL|nr:hypothetical protein LUZ61_017534 [Rhynchospora tenuis]